MALLERRIGLLFGLFLLLLVFAGLRATWLVGVQGDNLRGRAAQQQVQEIVVPARRGAITDGYGLAGIEQSREKQLHGKDGKRRIVSDALGDPVSIVDLAQARPGQDVQLTIDSAIQERVESVLAGVGRAFQPKGATALVLDPRNGEILSLANWPPVTAERFGDAPAYARQNRAVGASYEPGS